MVNFKDPEVQKSMDNIWYYYKNHIKVGIAIFISIIAIIIYQKTAPKYDLNICLLDVNIKPEATATLQKDISEAIYGQDRKVYIDPLVLSSAQEDKVDDAYVLQRFSVRYATGEIDMIICDKDTVDMMINNDGIYKLNDIVDKQYYEDGVSKDDNLYAISAKNIKELNKLNINLDEKYICIPDGSDKKDVASTTLKWLISNN